MTHLKFIIFLLLVFSLFSCKSKSKEVLTMQEVKEETQDTATNGKAANTNFTTHNVPWSEIQSFGKVPYDFLVPYGPEALQIGELRTPLSTTDTFPLVIYLHGGCWLSEFNLDYVSTVAADLVKDGYAVWVPEYRRVGDEGGGYPNTFKDIQASVNHTRTLAEIYPIDLDRVVVMGHSAGGHLALWLATQKNLSKDSQLYDANPLLINGVIALAAITDLVAYNEVGNSCSTAVPKLMGGTPEDMAARYFKGSPINLLPANIPLRLVHGSLDNIVPLRQMESFTSKAKAAGDDIEVLMIDGGGHFDMASPYSAAWKVVKEELKEMID